MSPRKLSAAPDLIISREMRGMVGTPVFAKTRVTVQSFFESLIAGEPMEEFARRFPRFDAERPRELLRRVAALIASGELTV